jgi:DNA modification methylase
MKKRFKLMEGNNMDCLKKLPDNSIDSIVSDPPYGLSFMNKKWDYDVPSVEFWKEVFRVLKPGGHILSFGGTRTYHRMVVAIEDAGFEIRDQIQWIYASGFPKSLNIGKAVDKLKGNEREVVGKIKPSGGGGILLEGRSNASAGMFSGVNKDVDLTKGSSPYEGWGSSLKPANEPICLARKPLSEKSVAENVLRWKTGGLNIDGCRIGNETIKINGGGRKFQDGFIGGWNNISDENITNEGRFPANLILECLCDDVIKGQKGTTRKSRKGGLNESDFSRAISPNPDYETAHYNDTGDIHTNPNCPCYLMDEQTGYLKSGEVKPHHKKNKTAGGYQGSCYGKFGNEDTTLKGYGGGGASRFFYQAKVSKKERNMGLDGFEDKSPDYLPRISKNENGDLTRADGSIVKPVINKNTHPTLKPVSLMAYLCRLITPEGGIVLDPFMGSGSTGIAAMLEGFKFVGMELDADYMKIAETRIENFEKYREFHQPSKGLKNGNNRMASRSENSNSIGLGICKKPKE